MAAQKIDPSFKVIDDALANYYIRLGCSNYRDSDGIGLFLKYIIDEELNDPDLPIEKELGDDCNPNDCAYSWMNNDTEFPLPSYAEIPGHQKEAFIYYILQYCHKHKEAPSDQYIQSIIIPKCAGTINDTLPTPLNNNNTTSITEQMVTNQNDDDSIELPAMDNINTKQSDDIEYDEGAEGIPQSTSNSKESLLRSKTANKYIINGNNDTLENEDEDEKGQLIQQQHIKQFIDEECDDDDDIKYIGDDLVKEYDVLNFQMIPVGAKRNIYIDKQFTKSWMKDVRPRFNDEAMMYYWLDFTTAVQMIQKYAKQYINKEDREFIVAVINYELRDNSNNILYGIILCDDHKIGQKNAKYPYKLKTLMTKQQLHDKYGINVHDLPKKSRKNPEFINKLLLKRRMFGEDLNKINWSNLKLFKSQSTNNNPINSSITITQKVMEEYCFIALERLNNSNKNTNNNILIPIVAIDKQHNYYGIEWVLIVDIIHRNCDVGIAFVFNEKMNTFIATSIYLDKKEIESKHKLIGLKFDYCEHLRPFGLSTFKIKSDRNQTTNQQQQQQNMAAYQYGGWIQGYDGFTGCRYL